MEAQEEIKTLKIKEYQLIPEGNVVNLVLGVGLCAIGYIIYDAYETNFSIALMIFGPLMFIAGALSFLWKSPVIYLIEAPILATVAAALMLNIKMPIAPSRAALAVVFMGYAAWVVVNDIRKFVALSSVRSKLNRLSDSSAS